MHALRKPRMHPVSERWVAAGFAIGSLCFFIGPFPGFLQLVGARADAWVFFIGSIFFTAAAGLELLNTTVARPRRDAEWWSAAIQFVGTLFFNLSTGNALRSDLSTLQEDRLIWVPDVWGSACFLISGVLAYRVSTSPRTMAAVNLAGCVLFGIAAIASYFVPDTGDMLDLAAANWTTAAGAACFFAGAVMLAR
ncbi:MAG TPA: YrhK family protein [Solirubrobacter sp.]|nr:YrhK family protein [Solirubrobacter sp.]